MEKARKKNVIANLPRTLIREERDDILAVILRLAGVYDDVHHSPLTQTTGGRSQGCNWGTAPLQRV